jgi:hypothetical protein
MIEISRGFTWILCGEMVRELLNSPISTSDKAWL